MYLCDNSSFVSGLQKMHRILKISLSNNPEECNNRIFDERHTDKKDMSSV